MNDQTQIKSIGSKSILIDLINHLIKLVQIQCTVKEQSMTWQIGQQPEPHFQISASKIIFLVPTVCTSTGDLGRGSCRCFSLLEEAGVLLLLLLPLPPGGFFFFATFFGWIFLSLHLISYCSCSCYCCCTIFFRIFSQLDLADFSFVFLASWYTFLTLPLQSKDDNLVFSLGACQSVAPAPRVLTRCKEQPSGWETSIFETIWVFQVFNVLCSWVFCVITWVLLKSQ